LGDLLRRLPPHEALGIWPRLDFRFDVPLSSLGGALALVALAVLITAVIRTARRGEFAVLSALVVSAGLFAATSTRSPYTAAKGLVIVAPLVTLVLAREGLILHQAAPRGRSLSMLGAGLVAALLAVGAYSDL